YVIYDLITLRDNDMRDFPCAERYMMLEELLENQMGLLAPMAWSEDEKQAMIEMAEVSDWEGLMLRRLDGRYTSSRSAQLLKYKLWATCTCRVLTVNNKRSVQIALLDDEGIEQACGNVAVPVNYELPEPDDLIEVRYLYVTKGGSLYQPNYLRVRDDIEDADTFASLRAAPPEKSGVLPAAA